MIDDELDFAELPVHEPKPCCNCGKITETVACVIDGVLLDGEPSDAGEHCYDCCVTEGFCFGCGRFSAGQTSYDFGRIRGYCENCQDQIRSTIADHDEDDEDLYDFYSSLP